MCVLNATDDRLLLTDCRVCLLFATVSAGVNPATAIDSFGATCLHKACAIGDSHLTIVKFLIASVPRKLHFK